ncbi:MAG: S66 peptidase family protein [Pseudonocardiaceae bacterium]
MRMVRPKSLRAGGVIGVVSVSAPEPATEGEFFDRGVAALEQCGYDVVLGKHTTGQQGYVTASGEALAADLHELFSNQRVSAIVCAGGGVNANRLLRHLSFDIIGAQPKILVGVSNPTVLLNAITEQTGLITFHGPSVVWDFGVENGAPAPALTRTHFWELLGSREPAYAVPVQKDWRWLRKGDLSGRVIAGNLASLQGLLGTPYEPNWDDAVLFWEDIAKPVNRLDMTLTHFRDAGVFDRINGMVVGKLVACEPSDGVTYDAMLLDLLRGNEFPILTEVPFGHTAGKLTLPIGAQLHASPDSDVLQFEFPA